MELGVDMRQMCQTGHETRTSLVHVTAEPTEPPGSPEDFMCDSFYNEEHLKGSQR